MEVKVCTIKKLPYKGKEIRCISHDTKIYFSMSDAVNLLTTNKRNASKLVKLSQALVDKAFKQDVYLHKKAFIDATSLLVLIAIICHTSIDKIPILNLYIWLVCEAPNRFKKLEA